jgi:asparagine synthase (glutamine-hydrolysing)
MRPLLLSRLYPYIPRSGPNAAYWKQFFAVGLTDTDNPCYSHHIRWHNTIALKRFFAKSLRERIGTYDPVAEFRGSLPEGFDSWAPLSKAQYTEVATFMSTYLLASQGDRVSASHGIEGRFPFLDVNVIEYASRIPPKYKIRALEEKRILRLAAAGIIPDSIRRRGKQPYRAPDSVSFFNNPGADYVREALDEGAVAEAGCFEPQMVKRLVSKCTEAKTLPSARDDMALVGILSTQLLYEQMIRNVPREEPNESEFRVRTAEVRER